MQLNITKNIILKLIYFNLQKFSFKEKSKITTMKLKVYSWKKCLVKMFLI